MVKIEFLGPINKEDMDLDITNLSQLSEILKKDAEVSTWLTNCAVAVNDTLVTSKDIPLKMEIKYHFYLLFVVDDFMDNRKDFLQLFDGSLPVEQITNAWYEKYKNSNYGAIITFVGVVRDENKIEGLSFDIYEPILNSWFDTWQKKANDLNAIVLMAHSRGDVFNHESSYIAAVCSPKRRVALELIDEFVEDFKAQAPIWKYDIIDNKRVYAQDRSTAIKGSGLLV